MTICMFQVRTIVTETAFGIDELEELFVLFKVSPHCCLGPSEHLHQYELSTLQSTFVCYTLNTFEAVKQSTFGRKSFSLFYLPFLYRMSKWFIYELLFSISSLIVLYLRSIDVAATTAALQSAFLF